MGLSEDLALALSAESIRIERLPGRASVGIEVPNPGGGEIIALRDVVESEKFQSSPSLLTLALGKDIHGEPIVNDLRAMPHLLIAGTTGSGKSVAINALITSILFKARPDEVKFDADTPARRARPRRRQAPPSPPTEPTAPTT